MPAKITYDLRLIDVCTVYYFPLNRKIRHDETRRQYLFAIADFSRFLKRDCLVSDLTDDNISLLMGSLESAGLAARTINERRGRLHALWSWLCRRGVLSVWPTTCRLSEPERVPLAWRESEIGKLFQAAALVRGNYAGVPKWLWWTCLLGVLWDTGERIGALLQIRWENLDLDGRWLIIPAEMRKGGRRDMTYRLSPETVANLRLLAKHKTPLIFAWPRHHTYLWQAFGGIIKAAGLPVQPRQKFHRVRRSVASAFTAAGGNAQRLLGHSAAAVTEKYLDPRILPQVWPCDLREEK